MRFIVNDHEVAMSLVWPARFGVVEEPNRRRTLEPDRSGLVVFNLNARRIVQVQNSYAEPESRGRGHVRRNCNPTRTLYHREPPPNRTIVP